jgi:predicted nucleic acid-binding protein
VSRRVAVIDASVAIKWLLPEEGRDLALGLQNEYQEGAIDLIAPELIVSEIGNVLWRRMRRGELTSESAVCFLPVFSAIAPC